MTSKEIHEKFIAFTSDGVYGHFGNGTTLEEALDELKKVGGEIRRNAKSPHGYRPKKGYRLTVLKATSELPFAPSNREATEQEADCYLSEGGLTISSLRCKYERIPIE